MFGPVPTPFSGGDVAIDRTGELVAVTGGYERGPGDVRRRDRARRSARFRAAATRDVRNWRDTGAVVFDAAGDVYLGSMAGPVREVDARTLEVRRTLAAPPHVDTQLVALTGADGLLVTAGRRGPLAIDLDRERRWVTRPDR